MNKSILSRHEADFKFSSPPVMRVKRLLHLAASERWYQEKRKKRNAELNLFKGCFLTNHFSVLFAGKANMVNTTLKRNLTIYSSQLKDLSNYQAFKHNFSSEGSTKSASVPKECRTIAPGRVLTACAVIQWITVIECVPKACTHCVLIRRLRGNLWLRKWYLPVDCLWIIMHFWITVKNQFLFFFKRFA